MKISMYQDEMYPVYSAVDTETIVGEVSAEWPSDLSFEDYKEAVALFHEWQDHLEIIYKTGTPIRYTTSWSTISSPSATTTSSTLTF